MGKHAYFVVKVWKINLFASNVFCGNDAIASLVNNCLLYAKWDFLII